MSGGILQLKESWEKISGAKKLLKSVLTSTGWGPVILSVVLEVEWVCCRGLMWVGGDVMDVLLVLGIGLLEFWCTVNSTSADAGTNKKKKMFQVKEAKKIHIKKIIRADVINLDGNDSG